MKKGFTLLELMIVVAIIGMLVAISTANLSKVKKRAADAESRQNIKVLQQGLELYNSDSGTYYIHGSGWYTSGERYANFNGYGYRGTNHVNFLETNGYITKGQIPQYSAGATWLMKKGEYKHPIMIYSCNTMRGETWSAGVKRFSKGYSISTKLNYPTEADTADLATQCGGAAAISKGMNYGLQLR